MLGTITLTVGQPDGVSVAQKEDTSETMDTIADEQAPQVNGEKVEKESPDANDITPVEEKAAEEKPNETGEVGFKKIFRFVGFKFTLKKDKSEEKDPVKLLTVRDKDGEVVNGLDEPPKDESNAEGENGIAEEKVSPDTETEVTKDTTNAETPDGAADAAEATDEAVKDEVTEKEEESSPPPQETTLSPFRKLFSTGLFSNLRKKSSIKRTKEEEDKEAAGEDEAAKTEEGGDKPEAEQETKEEATVCQEKEKAEEEAPASPDEAKPEPTSESEVTADSPASDETKQEEEKAEEEKSPVEVTSDSELVSSQEKVKPQGSPLKKLFTGAGLKKRSSKNKKSKKDTEAKLTESGEQSAELQSSTESTEAAKADSGPSSPEKSGEHVVEAEGEEIEGEVVSDGEKKKEGVVVWSSFKKLVTPRKRVKRPSESDDEVTSEKAAKSATLSSSESAPLADKGVEEEAKEEKPSEDESKAENTEEKLVSSTEEPKKKMDTSVSWEALMCMGGPKKRTRKTSDSDDEETKIDEESAPAAEEGKQEEKNEEGAVNIQNVEAEGEGSSSPEPPTSPPEKESAWDTLKRMVMPKSKAKSEEKTEESTEQVQTETEVPKDESSFSLRKLFPGLRKKKVEKQASTDSEEDSDTPAVVPLSEYETKPEEQTVETTSVAKVSSEERTPSWIAATGEQGDDKHDQLSDITEEAENVATPKSVDTDNVEDDTEEQIAALPKSRGRKLSVAEVAQAPPAETTSNETQGLKTEKAQESVAAIEAEISEIPPVTTSICEDPPIVTATEEFEPPLEQAVTNTHHLLESHARDKAVAICTGLGTKEIAKLALEKPATEITECVSVVTDALSTEVLVEEDSLQLEKAIVTEDALLNVQVQQVRSTEIEPVQILEKEVLDVQTAGNTCEPVPPAIATVNTLLDPQTVESATNVTPTVELQNGEVENNNEFEHARQTITPNEEVCVIKETVVLISPPSDISELEDATKLNGNEEESSQIEAQSSVIAQSVIQDAVDKVSVQPKTPESSAPMTPVQAMMTTEKEIEFPAETAVITDTPVTNEKSKEKPLFVALECESVPIEVTKILDPSVLGDEKPEESLKKVVEVNASEEFVIVEEVVEIIGEGQINNKLEAVKEELEEEKPQPEVKEIHHPVQMVLNSAQVVEEESFQEEAVEEIGSNGLADGQGDRPASEDLQAEERTPSKCAEVMAQVMEVIEEAVKEIQPVSTEITPAS
nr:A-kinase anchor protein 12-like [Nerophis lumbriciformis]